MSTPLICLFMRLLIFAFYVLIVYSIQILSNIDEKRVTLVIKVLVVTHLYIILYEDVIYNSVALTLTPLPTK